jgi:hypothetical protein
MIHGISGAPLLVGLQYGDVIQRVSAGKGFPPMLAYPVAYRETIRGEIAGDWLDAATVMSQNGDGGHGLFQITPEDWWPAEMVAEWNATEWQDPASNCAFAIKYFLIPALDYWASQGLTGDALIICVADEFNAGRDRVEQYHAQGNADGATTGGDYGHDVDSNYNRLLAGKPLV